MGRPQADPTAPNLPYVPDCQQQPSPTPSSSSALDPYTISQTAAYQPQPVPFPPQQVQYQAHVQTQPQPVAFPPQPPLQATSFAPQPQPYKAPVNYPPVAGAQQIGQTVQPAHGVPYPQPHVNTPVAGYGGSLGTMPWTTDLFGCFEDPTNALITALVPCVTFGQIAEILDNGQSTCVTGGLIYCLIASCFGIPCIYSCSYRTKLRSRYSLVEVPAPDWLTHFLCEWCALCQAYRELKNRGLDPAIGWQGNMMVQAQQQQQIALTAPVYQTMGA